MTFNTAVRLRRSSSKGIRATFSESVFSRECRSDSVWVSVALAVVQALCWTVVVKKKLRSSPHLRPPGEGSGEGSAGSLDPL